MIIPICFMTLLIVVSGALYFYNEALGHGYSISYLPFLKYWLIWIIPTICITVTMSVSLDILFNNVFMTFGIQFIYWLLSIATFTGNYEIWRTVIRFSSFGMSEYYHKIKNEIYLNRIFMLLLSALLIGISIYLFERERKGKSIKAGNYIKKFKAYFINIGELNNYKGKNRKFLFYQLKLVFGKNILISVFLLLVLLIRFGKLNMTEYDIKTTGENVLIFISMFVLLPLCNIEKRNGISEFTYTGSIPYARVFFTRFIIGIMIVIGFITFSLYILATLNKVFSWWVLSICIS